MARARKPAVRLVTGHEEIDRKLKQLALRDANRIVRTGMTKAARIILAAQKQGVPSQYKEAKKALGMKVKSNKAGQLEAKVGAAVAKKQEPPKRKGSVGITPKTIVWYILGTAERKRTKVKGFLENVAQSTGTGRMPAILGGIIKEGFSRASSGALKRMRAEIWAGIEKVAAKK